MSGSHPIEVESFRILHERVDLSAWPSGAREVVARMIHATADPDLAASVRIGAEAVPAALGAFESGAPVIVDAAMVAAGAPNVRTTCLLPEVPVAPPGSTRAAAAIALAARRHPVGALWVIGNAPTALAELLALHDRGLVEPGAVIGVPVGFVAAAEAKAALWASGLAPRAITNVGERGGSAVAAAALNALHRLNQRRVVMTPHAAGTPADDPRPFDHGARGPAAPEGLLLVAHGSRSPDGVGEVMALGAAVAQAMPELAVDLGFLELAEPPAGPVLDGLVARGCRRIAVQPLMLLAAGHGKSDVPAIVLEGRARHPHVELVFGSALGVVPELLAIAAANLASAGAAGIPLLVVARGTSDPDANAEACRAARLLAEWSGAPEVDMAFTGVTWPSVPDALERVRRLGHRRLAVFFWFLATGKLVERARNQLAAFAEEPGLDIVDAGYFGPDPGLVPVIAQRRSEAVAGLPRTNCDTCSYRADWPGLAERVGQPRGVGHSALAIEHRHRPGQR